jgi:hypothetical protein
MVYCRHGLIFFVVMILGLAFVQAQDDVSLSKELLANRVEKLMDQSDSDPKEIFKLSQSLAKDGSFPRGLHLLAHCYSRGLGVEKDNARAFDLYKESARAGYAPAINSLGYCYLNGLGTGVDHSRAYGCFVEAALMQDRNAKFNLGYMYENGFGTERNLSNAVYWYKQAADGGSALAKERLEVLGVDLAPAHENYAADGGSRNAGSLHVVSPISTKISQAAYTSSSMESNEDRDLHSSKSPENERSDTVIVKGFDYDLLWWAIGGGFILVAGFFGYAWYRGLQRIEGSTRVGVSLYGDLVFSCVECGQPLLIPEEAIGRILECPSCGLEYEAWRDGRGIMHLENKHAGAKRRTRISFGDAAGTDCPYQILGVDKDCTIEEVKHAFKILIKQYHPDLVANLGVELRELAAHKARELNDAYQKLLQRHA